MSTVTIHCAYYNLILLILAFQSEKCELSSSLKEESELRFKKLFGLDQIDQEPEYSGFEYIHDYMLTLYNRHADNWPANLRINLGDDFKHLGRIDQIKSHLPINISSEKFPVHMFNLSRTIRDENYEHITSEFRIQLNTSAIQDISFSLAIEDVSHQNQSQFTSRDQFKRNNRYELIKLKNISHEENGQENWFSIDVTRFINQLISVGRQHMAIFHIYVEHENPLSKEKRLVKRSISNSPITRDTAKFQSHLVTYLRGKRNPNTNNNINHQDLSPDNEKQYTVLQKLKRNRRSVRDEMSHRTEDKVRRRQKRWFRHQRKYDSSSYNTHYLNMMYNMCQRRPLYVDFDEINWRQWIYAPVGFDAGYCAGECPNPLAQQFNTTNHAIIQLVMHTKHPDRVPRPCCVPNQYASQPMLIFNNGEAILKRLEQMVVLSCACQ